MKPMKIKNFHGSENSNNFQELSNDNEKLPKEGLQDPENLGKGIEKKKAFQKKLLIVTDTYFPKKDGVIIFLKKIIPSIQNLEITVLAPRFKEDQKPIKNSELVTIPISNRFKLADYPSIKFSRENLRKIKRYVQEADVLFVQDVGPLGALSIRYAYKLKKPIVSYVHQITWEQLANVISTGWVMNSLTFIFRRFVKRLYNKCDLLIVPYKSLALDLRNRGILTKEAVIKLGVSSDIFAPPENKAEAKKAVGIDPFSVVIGYCGRISKEKDTNTLRRAYSRLKDDYQKIYLLIIGGGSKEEVEKFRELRDVKITGFISNVPQYLQAIDIFVMPSLTETTSLATVEAMSAGLAVISTKVGYIKEYIMSRQNGLFFPKKDDYILRKKLEMLIKDKRQRQFLGENARKTVVERFRWDKTVREINQALNMF